MKRGFFTPHFWRTAYVCLLVLRKFILRLCKRVRKEVSNMETTVMLKRANTTDEDVVSVEVNVKTNEEKEVEIDEDIEPEDD